MKRYTFLILACLFSNLNKAQIKLIDEILLNENLPVTENIRALSYKFKGDTLCYVRILPEANSNNLKLIITRYNLATKSDISRDTIYGVPEVCNIHDIALTNNTLLLTGTQKYIAYDFNTNSHDIKLKYQDGICVNKDIPPFKSCEFINDSIAIMYIIYDYHSAEYKPGLYINTFNIKSKEIEHNMYAKYKGVGISYINKNWLAVSDGKIYVVTPLSGILSVYNKDLKLLEEIKLNLFPEDVEKDNLKFEKELDSISYIANDIDHSLTKVYAEQVYNRLDSTKTYIDGLFSIDKKTLGLSIYKPSYGNAYRDFALVNTETFVIDTLFSKWNCGASNTLEKIEDLFPVNIHAPENTRPYFRNGWVYNFTLMQTSMFEPGDPAILAEKVFKSIAKNGYQCSVVKYRFLN